MTTATTTIVLPNDVPQVHSLGIPFRLAVTLSGQQPENLSIPVHISASVPDEYAPFVHLELLPLRKDTSVSPDAGPPTISARNVAPHGAKKLVPTDKPITFMPLPTDFNHQDHSHWERLSRSIESWLISSIATPTHPQWRWGRDLFWIAFVAAFPTFPSDSDWYMWNPRITMEGPFIEEWMARPDYGDTGDIKVEERLDLWARFQQLVYQCYPYPSFDA